jgi:hypothetical protein
VLIWAHGRFSGYTSISPQMQHLTNDRNQRET